MRIPYRVLTFKNKKWEGQEMRTLHSMFQWRRGGVWLLRNGIAAVAAWLVISIIIIGAHPLFAVDNLIDHDVIDKNNVNQGKDPVLTNPNLYITYWGSDWSNGFAYFGIPSSQYQTYLEGLLNGVGGGPWIGTQAQYRNAGSQPGVVKGTWIDPVDPVKITPTSTDIQNEVLKSILYFKGYWGLYDALISSKPDPNDVYLIAFPPGYGPVGFAAKGGPACAWHSAAYWRPYIVLPFMPDAAGMGCGVYSVNPFLEVLNDKFGHGFFDGDSLAAGHEWAETLTDPFTRGGWYGQSGLDAETGDKCASTLANISVGGNYYAMQALWSNNDGRCVFGAAPLLNQSPASNDFSIVILYNSSSPITITLTNNGDLDARVDYHAYITGADPNDFEISGDTCIIGTTLHPGGSCKFDVTFRPTALGLRQAAVGVNASDPQGKFIATPSTTLVGTGDPQWAVFDPNSIIRFGGVLIQSTGQTDAVAELPVSLWNQGGDPRYIQKVEIGGPQPSDFSILEDGCSNQNLGPSQSCTVYLRFQPTATGERQAELELVTVMDASTGVGETLGIPVIGTGLGPVAQLSTTNLSFGDATYNSDGAATRGEIPVSGEVYQAITFTSSGQSPLWVNGVEVTGDFALDSNGCTQPLQPNDFCTIRVRLMPTHFQLQSGTLMIYDNTSDSPHEVKLTGSVGASFASLVPDEVQFGPVPVGSTSSPQTVWLENLEGEAALRIQSAKVYDLPESFPLSEASDDFTATSDCPQDLLIGKCTITVTLKPTATGPRNGILVVTDNAPNSPQQVPLFGTGCTLGEPDCPDTIPPVLTMPADITAEATSPAGAVVSYPLPTVTDDADPAPAVSCSPVSGSTFPLGVTTVTCTATDASGNSSNGTFKVNVVDTTAPAVTPPSNITVPVTEAGGARGGEWPALAAFLSGGSAVDAVDPAPVRLTPQVAGVDANNSTLFPVGTTPVTFRFQDSGGNIGSATANVTVTIGTPRLSGKIAAKGKSASGALFVDLQFTNTGTGNARNIRLNQLMLRTLSGTGTVSYNTPLSPALPYSVGNLNVGGSTVIRFYLNVSSTVSKFSITENGTVQDVAGISYNYSIGQAVIP